MKWSRSEKISVINIVIAILGFLLVFVQLKSATLQFEKSQLNQRAQFLSQLHERAFADREMTDVFRKIEYGGLIFNANFHNSLDQKALIKLLSFFEFVGQLEDLKLIELSDVSKIFGYYIIRVHQNQAVKEYLKFLGEWTRGQKIVSENLTFPHFERLAKTIPRLKPHGEKKSN
ncbi:MAG: hypothetical protein ACFFDI_29100 [Promethearchaeota archaeon]